jgi:hypothetical protein
MQVNIVESPVFSSTPRHKPVTLSAAITAAAVETSNAAIMIIFLIHISC